jgi:uncharacterized protein
MGSIIVFGAAGRAGRRVVAEAEARGHKVTAVARNADDGSSVRGDVTDADAVAALAAGHDAAVNAAARMDVPAGDFFPAAARALVDGLGRAGVARLVAIGLGTVLRGPDGAPVYDSPGFPAAHRTFSLGHAAQIEVLEAAPPGLDWALLVPPPVLLDDAGPRTGRYRLGDLVAPEHPATFSYADLAVALVDEVEAPTVHRRPAAVHR